MGPSGPEAGNGPVWQREWPPHRGRRWLRLGAFPRVRAKRRNQTHPAGVYVVVGEDFDEFVRARSTGLLRVAYLLTGERGAAEDLVQEVLEQMYVHWRRIRGAPEAYARRALVNRATNRWRRRKPETELHGVELSEPDHSDGVAVREAVLEALRELPPKQRATVVLRYLDDLPVAEVAAAMNCSIGTVKSNTRRGIDRLRELLGPNLFVTDGER